ncbi:MAG: Amino acid/amide transporter ATP-binding protein 1, family [Bradyrhizobium sp.]|jgi:branched-chain amino acid transport system ATP-binding protein|nr:Amino acid/amide transporter ATP-binding protein 1, family [Bradyrhizobium sp.]
MGALLETSGLSRHFGGLVAVSDVAMEVAAGTVHGLIGPNGAGKTTMLNLISGHLASSAGQIQFEGNAVTRWPVERRARLGIRRTFQNLKLFRDMTVLENVMIGMHGQTHCEIWHALLRTARQKAEEITITERAREALDFVGLMHLADMQGGSLPYGSQRLVEIARAIVARPKLLLLDEPAAGLNGNERTRMVGLIRAIRANGATILLVEHHMDVVMPSCDCITVFNYGKRLANGNPTEIRAHPEVIKAYLGGGLKRRAKPGQNQRLELAHASP